LQVIKDAEADEIYNLAGQSSVGLSFDQPVETIDSSVKGTLNILEAMRFLKSRARLYSASSSESFGNLTNGPANEETPFHPCSPYGIGKAAAQSLVSFYRQAYGLFACSGILFNHESPLRPARFVTQKIIRGALDIAEGKARILPLGYLEVGRDWGWAPEYVDAMWRMLQLDRPEDFVVATGRLHTLREFVELVFAEIGLDWKRHVIADSKLFRPMDIITSVGNPEKARKVLGWGAKTNFSELVKKLIACEIKRRHKENAGCSGGLQSTSV
jgi:GDPmannose 4,6-dehydratase